MKYSFDTLKQVTKSYKICYQNFFMDIDSIFVWIGYVILGLIISYMIVKKCWKFFRFRFGRNPPQPVEVMLPSSVSSSFTYIQSPKPNIFIPEGVSDGLSDFNDSILFDQPTVLSNLNPFCSCKAVPGYSSDDRRTSTESRGSQVLSEMKYVIEDDQNSVNCLVNSFNKSILSISSGEYDINYCEGPTILMDDGTQESNQDGKSTLGRYSSFLGDLDLNLSELFSKPKSATQTILDDGEYQKVCCQMNNS